MANLAHRPLRAAYRMGVIALALTAPHSAFAELSNESFVGPAVRSRPAYDGSDSQRGELVPMVRYFGHPWFVRSTQGVLEGGARMALSPELSLGAQLAYEPGRKSSDSDFLERRGVEDVDRGASIGAHIEWDHKFGIVPTTLLARARQHTASDRGAQADLRLSVGLFRKGPVGAGLFTQATWADVDATRSLYGITPRQSAATGLRAYDPGSGLLFTSVGLLWSIDLARNWIAAGSLEARHLRGDAQRSPLVERASNHYLSAGVAYRF